MCPNTESFSSPFKVRKVQSKEKKERKAPEREKNSKKNGKNTESNLSIPSPLSGASLPITN